MKSVADMIVIKAPVRTEWEGGKAGEVCNLARASEARRKASRGATIPPSPSVPPREVANPAYFAAVLLPNPTPRLPRWTKALFFAARNANARVAQW